MDNSSSIRLNKYISESGICSRREADKYIESGNVFINGRRAKMGDQVRPGDRVRVNGNEIEPRAVEDAIYILFNKPVGVTCTTDTTYKGNIISYINYGERIFPVGRLDKDSQGLIILTSNGDIVNKILRAGNDHEKEYVVTVNKPINESFVKTMSNGVPILGVNTKKCRVEAVNANTFKITLVQGLNRQIRRMCEYLGYEVVKLERIRIMHLTLKGIPLGEYRELKKGELDELFSKIENSKSVIEKKSNKPKSSTPKKESSAIDKKKMSSNQGSNLKSSSRRSGLGSGRDNKSSFSNKRSNQKSKSTGSGSRGRRR